MCYRHTTFHTGKWGRFTYLQVNEGAHDMNITIKLRYKDIYLTIVTPTVSFKSCTYVCAIESTTDHVQLSVCGFY